MPTDPTTVYNAVHLALGGTGLLVVAAYFSHAQARVWRRATPAAPAWETPLADTFLLVFVGLIAALAGMMIGAGAARFFPGGEVLNSPVQNLGANVGMFAFVPLGLLGIVRYIRSHPTPVAPITAGGAPRFPEAVGLGVLTFLGTHALMLGPAVASGKLLEWLQIAVEKQPALQMFGADTPPAVRAGLVIVAVCLAPVTEEIVFRAGLFRILRAHVPRWLALGLSAAVFAAAHTNVAAFVPLVVLGVVWAHMYEKSGSLTVSIVAHGLFNLTNIALVLGGWAPNP